MPKRESRRTRPWIEAMEGRLALSSMTGSGPPPGGHHDVVDVDPNHDVDPPGHHNDVDAPGHHHDVDPPGHH